MTSSPSSREMPANSMNCAIKLPRAWAGDEVAGGRRIASRKAFSYARNDDVIYIRSLKSLRVSIYK